MSAAHAAEKVDVPTAIAYTVGMQYTLRGIPRAVDNALRKKAKQEHRSLNEVAIEVLSSGIGLHAQPAQNHSLDFAIASWVEDPEFDNCIEDQRQIDPELWK